MILGQKDYAELRQSTDSDDEVSSGARVSRRHFGSAHLCLISLINVLVFVSSLSLLILSRRATPRTHCDTRWDYSPIWDPELSTANKVHETKFSGSFEAESKYRGIPSEELDHQWDEFTHSPWIDGTAVVLNVTRENIHRAGKDIAGEWFNSTVELSRANGGGYMATLEIFHQMHCLNMIRKAAYSADYPHMDISSPDNPPKLKKHVDHCIEIIRQTLMCHGDTGLITYHWVEGKDAAYPDFNTWHQCRDADAILDWAQSRAAPMVEYASKTAGVIQMPTPP